MTLLASIRAGLLLALADAALSIRGVCDWDGDGATARACFDDALALQAAAAEEMQVTSRIAVFDAQTDDDWLWLAHGTNVYSWLP